MCYVIEEHESFYLDEKLLNFDKPIKIIGLNCPNYDNTNHFEEEAIETFKWIKNKIDASENGFIHGFETDYLSFGRNELMLPDYEKRYKHTYHTDDLIFAGFLIWGEMEETNEEILARYQESRKEVSHEK